MLCTDNSRLQCMHVLACPPVENLFKHSLSNRNAYTFDIWYVALPYGPYGPLPGLFKIITPGPECPLGNCSHSIVATCLALSSSHSESSS